MAGSVVGLVYDVPGAMLSPFQESCPQIGVQESQPPGKAGLPLFPRQGRRVREDPCG